MRQGLLVVALFLAALAPFVLAHRCGPPTYQAKGELLSVTPLSRENAANVTLRTADGQVLAFRVHPQVELTLPELEDLQRRGRPVNVEYRQDGDELVALDITPTRG
jgi:hypothetical protein